MPHTLLTYPLADILALGLAMAVGAHVLIRRLIARPLLEAGEIFRRIAKIAVCSLFLDPP